MITNGEFKPAWWLSNPHWQTIAPKYLRQNYRLSTYDQVVETPDGDFVELSWTSDPNTSTAPIIMILHGLEGSIDSHYAKGMMSAIANTGWQGVLIHFRGCGKYPNKKPTSYHSGFTDDIAFLHAHLNQQFSNRVKAAIGFSLGGNVLAKYLANSPTNSLTSAVVICAPLHLASCSKRINQGFSKVYQGYLISMLKASTRQKITAGLLPSIDARILDKVNTMYSFDDLITAPINNFKNADDYYEKASACFDLSKIKTPTLIIHAQDDPFLCHESFKQMTDISPFVTIEISKNGGHVGFIGGKNPFKPKFWLEQRAPDFIRDHLK